MAVLMNTCSSGVLCHQNVKKLSLHLEKSGPVERRVEQHEEALRRGEVRGAREAGQIEIGVVMAKLND